MKKTVSDAVEYYGVHWDGIPIGAALYNNGVRWLVSVNNLSGHGWHLVCTRAEFEAEVERRKYASMAESVGEAANLVVNSENIADTEQWANAEWIGKYMPPVGCECEILLSPAAGWVTFVPEHYGSKYVIGKTSKREISRRLGKVKFRPLKTPQDREAEEMAKALEPYCNLTVEQAKKAIKAGVRLYKP